jgi:hypothetical protein
VITPSLSAGRRGGAAGNWLVPGVKQVCTVDLNQQPGHGDSTISCSSLTAARKYGLAGVSGRTLTAILPVGSSDVTATLIDSHPIAIPTNRNGAIAQHTPAQRPDPFLPWS